jgi:hypothetical protein
MENTKRFNNGDWKSWNGKRIWMRVCRLFGWDEENLGKIRLCSVNWIQNGYDCGPIACQIVQNLLNHGLSLVADFQKLPCCHALRKPMAETVNNLILVGFDRFDSLGENMIKEIMGDNWDSDNWTGLMDTLRRALEINSGSKIRAVIDDIDKAMMKCRLCQDMMDEIEERGCPIPLPRKKLEDIKSDRARKLLKGAKSMAALVNDAEGTDDEEEEEEEEGEGEGDRKVKAPFVVSDWTEAQIGRFPRPKTLPVLPHLSSLRGLNHPFDPHFDDYYNGPTLDALLTVPPEIMGYNPSLVYIANRALVNPLSSYHDRGYRLLGSYAQNYNLGKPVMFKEHICPVGLPNPPPSITDYHPERFGNDVIPGNANDYLVVGAEEILHMADGLQDDTLLLTGKIESGVDEFMVVDLEIDRVDPEEIIYSCDIDSLIWITRNPKFIGPVGVYAWPMIRNKAPIWKNNHVRVELLYPQSEEDREAFGPREEWLTKPWSLSNLPHLYFGTVSPGITSADILLFFPRMAHQDPHRHFWVNQIPKHIQDILWDRVISPALRSVLNKTQSVYFPVDRQHWRLKDGLGKNMNRTSQFPLQGDRLGEVVEEMSRIVSHCFFFFGNI